MKQNKINTLKKVKKVAIILLIVLVIALAAGIFVIGKMVNDGVLYQNKNNDTKGNSIKQLEVWGYDREAFHDKYQGNEFSVQSADGNTVPGMIYFSEEDQPWVILIHGAGGDHEFTIPYVEMFLEMNMNVLSYDQRGHGDNTDQRVTFGINETHDVVATGLALLVAFISSFFDPISPGGYRDIFISFSALYVVGAIVFYIFAYFEVKKMNHLLEEIQKR